MTRKNTTSVCSCGSRWCGLYDKCPVCGDRCIAWTQPYNGKTLSIDKE